MDKTRKDNIFVCWRIFSLNQQQSHKNVRNASENTDWRKIQLTLDV